MFRIAIEYRTPACEKGRNRRQSRIVSQVY
jgi:hypothetical protein